MNFPSFLRTLCLCISVVQLLNSPAVAQGLKSRPVGFLSVTIPTGQTRSFSVPFDAEVSSQATAIGRLTAVGANYLENSAARWTPGSYSTASSPYFVRLTSGKSAGRLFRIVTPANTATRIYVADDGVDLLSLGLEVGTAADSFEIIPGDTLATFFGTTAAGDSLVVHGSGDPVTADIVQVWGGAAWINFYYNTTWSRWARDTDAITDASRNDFLLRSDRGLMITRRGAGDLNLSVVGRVLATPQRSAHARTGNAVTFLATMQTGNVTLAELGLQLASRNVAWKKASDPAGADLLLVWSGATWFTFFYNSAAGHWQRVGDPEDRDGYVIDAGTPVFVQRVASGSSVDDKTITFPAPGT